MLVSSIFYGFTWYITFLVASGLMGREIEVIVIKTMGVRSVIPACSVTAVANNTVTVHDFVLLKKLY